MVNTLFSVLSGEDFQSKFPLDAEVLDIGKRGIVLGLSWVKKNGFVEDRMDRC